MVTKRTIIQLLCVFGLALAGQADAQPLAWHAEHPDASGELILLGSIHVLRETDYPLPPLIDELYSRSDQLVMELDLDSIDPIAMQSQLVAAAMSSAPGGLAEQLDRELYSKANREAAALGVELALLDRFEPWFVAITLSSLGVMKHGYQPEIGLEQHLVARARADAKTVTGLESVAQQVAVFDALSSKDQAALLEQTLAELNDTAEMMDHLISAWRSGELETLADELLAEFQSYPELYRRLVSQRNANWAQRLTTLVQEGETLLVVVGALHLVGDDSVIDSLADSGFVLERIR